MAVRCQLAFRVDQRTISRLDQLSGVAQRVTDLAEVLRQRIGIRQPAAEVVERSQPNPAAQLGCLSGRKEVLLTHRRCQPPLHLVGSAAVSATVSRCVVWFAAKITGGTARSRFRSPPDRQRDVVTEQRKKQDSPHRTAHRVDAPALGPAARRHALPSLLVRSHGHLGNHRCDPLPGSRSARLPTHGPARESKAPRRLSRPIRSRSLLRARPACRSARVTTAPGLPPSAGRPRGLPGVVG